MKRNGDRAGDLMDALQREIGWIQEQTRAPKRIRLNLGVPVGSMATLLIAGEPKLDEARAALGINPEYEVLIHPADWDRLIRDQFLSTVEANMRRDGHSDDEIDVAKVNAYANPQDFQVFGIPVVDDMPKVWK